MTTTTMTHDGRTYEVSQITSAETHPALHADLVSRGFDGAQYAAVSHPVGRQRKERTLLLARSATNGAWVVLFAA